MNVSIFLQIFHTYKPFQEKTADSYIFLISHLTLLNIYLDMISWSDINIVKNHKLTTILIRFFNFILFMLQFKNDYSIVTSLNKKTEYYF